MARLPKVPTTQHDLLIEALRTVDRMSGLLNQLSAEAYRQVEQKAAPKKHFNRTHALLRQRFNTCSGVHLFIAADKLRLKLPKDLRGDE